MIKRNILWLVIAWIALLTTVPTYAQFTAQDQVKFDAVQLQTVAVDYWTEDVQTIFFQAETSWLTQVVWFAFQWDASFDSTHIESLSLYEKHWNWPWLLTSTLLWNQILNNWSIYFNQANTSILMNPTERTQFRLDIDIVDSNSLPEAKFMVGLSGARVISVPSGNQAQVFGIPLNSWNVTYINPAQQNPAYVEVWYTDLPNQNVTVDRNNVLLGEFDITGDQDIELHDITFVWNNDFNEDVIDWVKLYLTNTNQLFWSEDIINWEAFFEDIAVNIPAWEIYVFHLLWDIPNDDSLVWSNIQAWIDSAYITNAWTNIEANVFWVPITFSNIISIVANEIDVVASNINNISVNLWSNNIDLIQFDVITDSWEIAEVEELVFEWNSNFDSDHITALRLWKKVPTWRELIDIDAWFDIEGGAIEFDDFDSVIIPEGTTQTFLVTADITTDEAFGNSLITPISLVEAEIDNDYNDEYTIISLPVSSNRSIYING